MEKMRVHTTSEYVPKSLIELETKLNEVIEKMNEMEKQLGTLSQKSLKDEVEEDERI